ncbi:putative small secreted protein [Chromohalobacter marismortui]|uniref:Putative small secreted protein n=1 Tax=Chromohalobacter marismortui TaxID=42055 RepID=A0A4R7NHR6_9GAMM|nr:MULTISPECIES: entericidin A/B family lipoprotein [Chromohalobacter]MCI0510912.1 entericidin A/B family lipoprotein [Chromohalobacter sp.]MCI0592940.1 entericidin A/B family lipoprotein [Chromohalobacter sp.]TDU20154.1 putative small secreted protein [Chromohalobacter marismortui]
MKRILAFSLLLMFTAGAISGCNTLEGVGEDIEEGGEEVQEAVD